MAVMPVNIYDLVLCRAVCMHTNAFIRRVIQSLCLILMPFATR